MRTQRSTDTDSQNRAEEIRRRRVTNSQQRVNTASSRATNPAPARPVTVRGAGYGTPIHRQVASKPRRQYYIAMDSASGSELRLPAIPMINIGWRLISGLIVILASVAVFSLLNSPFFKVNTVNVEGLQRLNSTDLQAVLRLENQSIIEVQPNQIRDAISVTFPELADVQVNISLPNAVTVTARERQPVLAWQMEDQTRWIDTEGYVFPARGEAGPLVTITTGDEIPLAPLSEAEIIQLQNTTPSVTGAANSAQTSAAQQIAMITGGIPTSFGGNRKADMALLNASLMLTKQLPEGTTLVYDDMNGLGWNDPQGWQVFIGKDLQNFDVKFALYQSIMKTLSERGIQPIMISVEHLNAPFYHLAEASVEQ